MTDRGPGGVSAVIVAFSREDKLRRILDHLAGEPLVDIVVFDNSNDALAQRAAGDRSGVRVIGERRNLGIAGRNRAADQAGGDLLLFLDDDSYPLPGAIAVMTNAMRADPTIGAIGGLVRDRDKHGNRLPDAALGSFDWWLRLGRRGDPPPNGFPTTGFSEGACVVRREAFVQAGGWFEPYFWQGGEIDLAIRLIANGWDVRYLPLAEFEHEKEPRDDFAAFLYHQQRNRIWFYWRHFPAALAIRRVAAYLLLDFVESVHRRLPGVTWRAVRDSWRLRRLVAGTRRPLPRDVISRAELSAGRMHLRLLCALARRSARRAFARARTTSRSPRAPRRFRARADNRRPPVYRP